MAECNIGISIQPGMMLGFMQSISGSMPGMRRMSRGPIPLTLKELVEGGVHIAGGSDAPCAGPDWKMGILGAILQGLSAEQAIRMYTIESAWLNHMENIKGSIEVGKLADFCILDKNILTISPKEIGDIQNLMTIVGGKIVYDAGKL